MHGISWENNNDDDVIIIIIIIIIIKPNEIYSTMPGWCDKHSVIN